MDDLNIDPVLRRRARRLNQTTINRGQSVIYVMSRDQRVENNHALAAAQQYAIAQKLPLAVVFCLKPQSGHRSREQYKWMLQGLLEVEEKLRAKSIPFMLLIGDPLERLRGCFTHLQPEVVFFDFSPLAGPRKLRETVAQSSIPIIEVDTHNVVPAWIASDKQEFSARTIRSKIHRQIDDFLEPVAPLTRHPYAWTGPVIAISQLQERIDSLLAGIASNGQSDLQKLYLPGYEGGRRVLDDFLTLRFKDYYEARNDPSRHGLSGLSPYLHFGQLSSLEVVLGAQVALSQDPELQKSYDVLVEEIVVRKELSDNYCLYNSDYMKLSGAPKWAIGTLARHRHDAREHLYSLEEFVAAETHDPAWNAAQSELLATGKMHGYMRMYWAKKVLEWTESPQLAVEYLIYINDFYSLDGGDPNGYAGILWSVGGLHDRPWGERPVYGTVRSMVYTGLKRKFNIQSYIDQYSAN